MAATFPKAVNPYVKLTNSNKASFGQQVVDGLLASIADFPTPPVDNVALQLLVTDYNTKLSESIGGSKQQRQNMRQARFVLLNALQQDSNYVNMIIQGLIRTGTSYPDAKTLILGTGYYDKVDPSPVGPLPAPIVKLFNTPNIGVLRVLLFKVHGAKGYQVNIWPTGHEEQSVLYTFSNTRIKIHNLISGQSYTFKVAAIGASTIRTYTVEMQLYIS